MIEGKTHLGRTPEPTRNGVYNAVAPVKLRVLLAGFFAAVLMSVVATTGAAKPAWASSPGGGGEYEVKTCEGESFTLSAAEYESLELHNKARGGAGLSHLCVNPILTEAARSHATDMIEQGYFSHDTPDGTTPIDRMEAAGYVGWNQWGENIAWGSGNKADSKEIFASLMDSPGHRENILKDSFLEVGVGVAAGSYDGYSDTGMYAMDFGARDGQGTEYPEVLSSNPGDESSPEKPADDDLEGEPVGRVTPEDQGGNETVEPQPEPGESEEEERQETADAQKVICETFEETREGIIGDLREDAEEHASKGEGDLASEIIAETKTNIADQFEDSLLNPSFCDFTDDGNDNGADDDPPGGETNGGNTTGGGSTSVEQVEKTTISQQNVGDENAESGNMPDGSSAPEMEAAGPEPGAGAGR